MKGVRAFLVPFLTVLMVGLGITAWLWREQTPSEPTTITFEQAATTTGYVTIEGMAHYAAVVRQDVPATLFTDAKVYWLYGFFPPYDTDSREITLLVRSAQQPEDLVHYELMSVTGRLARATPQEVPFETEVILGKNTDYYFADGVMLLTADRLDALSGE